KDEKKPEVKADPRIIQPLHRIPWAEGRGGHPDNRFYDVDLSPDNRYLAVGKLLHPTGAVRIWHLDTGKFVRAWWDSGMVRFTPDGKHVLLDAEAASMFSLRQVATGEEVRRFGPRRGYNGLGISSSGTRGTTSLAGPPRKLLVF